MYTPSSVDQSSYCLPEKMIFWTPSAVGEQRRYHEAFAGTLVDD
jgi:hypothetical protein